MDSENLWTVKPQGTGWAVKKGDENTLGSPLFADKQQALDYACASAKGSPPSMVIIYKALGDVEKVFNYV